MAPQEPHWSLLDRYFSGLCSPTERAAVDAWIHADPAHAQFLESTRVLWGDLGRVSEGLDTDLAWQRMEGRLGALGPTRSHGESTRGDDVVPLVGRSTPQRRADGARPGTHAAWWSIAAAAAVLVVVGARVAAHRPDGDRTQGVAAPQPREYTTRRGETAIVRLSDGSRLTLGPESRLRVPPGFPTTARTLDLEGEAAFDVRHDSLKPFLVRAGGAEVRDLGTEFVVRSYADTRGVDVAVMRGSVSLAPSRDGRAPSSGRRDSLILHQSEVGRVTASGQVAIIRRPMLADYAAWTTGRLVFTNVPLRDVLPRLNRWYDVDIRLGDASLGEIPYTATLTREPVGTAIELLAASVGARLEHDGETIMLYRLSEAPR